MIDDNLDLPLMGGQVSMPKRRCRKCGKSKPLDEFAWGEHRRRERVCKKCENARQRHAYATNPARKGYLDQWIKDNPDKVKAYRLTHYKKVRKDLQKCIALLLRSKRPYCIKRGIDFSIAANDVLGLYEAQNGLCALTGRQMTWGDDRGRGTGVRRAPHKDALSIDRIDQTRGYTVDNIRLVTFLINRARDVYSDEELLQLCRDVIAHHGAKAAVSPASSE